MVTKHLSNIFKEGELDENSVCAKFAQTADDGKTYNYKFYSLAAIIAVGYRINSERATQFRTWATKVLDTFTKQGYVLDKSRLINGQIFDEDYFEHLIAEIQEIRASERRFYQKITDIYATAVDYDKNSQVTREFYATVQNKMHYAVHGNTAAEVIVARADHNKEHMGLKSWKNAPDGKIVKTDVSIAKNYLEKEELAELNEIVTMYLDYATRQARRHIPMTMEDWKTKLDAFLRFNDAEVLQDKGKVTAAIAKEFAESEFEKYRVIQDERLREREKGPDGNNHGMFQKRWADHNYHEEGGESIAMVQKRNIEALNEILSDNTDKDIVIGTHGTALSTILNFYDSNFGCEDFLRIIDWMPYIIELDFESSCNEMESECPIYSFKLIAKQEHCYIEKEFKGKQRADKN